jgi:hypothetical protein
MYVHLSFHFSLIGLCPGLVDIHPGGDSTSKDLKLLAIRVHPFFDLGFQPCRHFFLLAFHFSFQFVHRLFLAGQQAYQCLLRNLFHFCNMTMQLSTAASIQSHF